MKATAPAPARLDAAPRIAPRLLTPRWAVVLAACWPAVTAVCVALEPAAQGEAGAVGNVIGAVFFGLLLVTAGAAAGLRPEAVRWAAFAGLGAAAMTMACPLTAHHTAVGIWWAGQWAAVVAGAAVTLAAHRSLRAG